VANQPRHLDSARNATSMLAAVAATAKGAARGFRRKKQTALRSGDTPHAGWFTVKDQEIRARERANAARATEGLLSLMDVDRVAGLRVLLSCGPEFGSLSSTSFGSGVRNGGGRPKLKTGAVERIGCGRTASFGKRVSEVGLMP
jgi:hypothetical protein